MKRTRRTEITIETHRVSVIRKQGQRMVGYCEHCGRETTVIRIDETQHEQPQLICSRSLTDGENKINTQKDHEK